MRLALFVVAILACLLAFSATSVQANAKCSVCKVLVTGVADKVKEYEGRIDDIFKKAVCQKFGRLEPVCNQFVEKYGPLVIKAILDKLNPDEVCKKFGFCSSDAWMKEIMSDDQIEEFHLMALQSEPIGQNTGCTLCSYAVETIKKYIDESQDVIKDKLMQQCQRLPDQLGKVCQTVVLLYGDKLIETVLKYPTEEACQKIGLCPKSANIEPVFLQPPVINEADFASPSDAKCSTCMLITAQAHAWLKSNATQAQIKAALHKVCDMIPEPYDVMCKVMVDEQLPNIIEFIRQKYPPERICEMLRMCDANKAVREEEPSIEKDAIPVCPLCMMVMTEVEKIIDNPKNKEKVTEALGKVCQRLPDKFQNSCRVLVATYAPKIIDKIIERANPSAVCRFIKACKDAKQTDEVAPAMPIVTMPIDLETDVSKKSTKYCALCLQVATYVHQNLANNQTQEQIITLLRGVCNKIPSMKDQCNAIVPVLFKQLVHWFLENEKPSVICRQLKLCDSASMYNDVELNSELVCKGCKTLVDVAHNYLTKESTVAEIKKALNRACGVFPPKLEGTCNNVVEQYGELLVRQIADRILDSDNLCEAIRACPRAFNTDADALLAQLGEELERHMMMLHE